MLRRFAVNYVDRHMHPVNRVLHLIGVPVTFIVSAVFLVRHDWWWAAACFVGGYALQFLGHAVEGNDAGEVVLVKRLLRKPYREFGPRSRHFGSSARSAASPAASDRRDLSKSDG